MSTLNWFKKAILGREEVEILEKAEGLKTSPILAHTKSNESLNIFLKDGSFYCIENPSEELENNIFAASSKEEIIQLTKKPPTEEELRVKFEQEKQKIRDELAAREVELLLRKEEILNSTGDFEVDGNTVKFKGINRTLPQLLVTKLVSVIEEEKDVEYLALKRFWYWTCLNPRAEVADLLFDFLSNNCLRLNKEGFFYALRNVVAVGDVNKPLTDFVSNAYNKVKAVWKRKPADYFVRQEDNGEFIISKSNKEDGISAVHGNLKELYDNIVDSEENRYTDAHTGTFDIRVGQVVRMNPEDCAWSTAECSHSGLHFTMDQINYVGCGDTSMLILINPMRVVGIGREKGRCYEYFPVMTVPREEVTQLLHDGAFDTLELDSVYAEQEIEDLEKKAKEGFAVEAKKHEINIPAISSKEITIITEVLKDIKTTLKERVKVYA